MSSTNPDPLDYIPLTPAVFHILLALSDGPRHGYGVMQAVEETAGRTVPVGPGTIYGSIQRMESTGLVAEAPDAGPPGAGRRERKYFALTDLGADVLCAEAERLAAIGDLVRARRIVGPETAT